MAKPVLTVQDAVKIKLPPEDLHKLLADPVRLCKTVGADGVKVRKLGNADRWVLEYRWRLGQRVLDLRRTHSDPPQALGWQTVLAGFRIDTQLTLTPAGGRGTRMAIVSTVTADSFRARMLSPVLKLAEARISRRLNRGLKKLATSLAR